MKLHHIRKDIDRIDRELVALLSKRMELGLRTRPYKKDTLDTSREQAVLDKADRARLGVLESDFIKNLFVSIINESKRLQDKQLPLVAFQGEHGAYSEIACHQLKGKTAVTIPNNRFSDVFSGLEDGGFDIGVVPVENSLEGAVTQVNNLLTTTNLKVIGETVVPICHCLLTPPGTRFEEIKTVYSHPQALGQCAAFLEEHNLEARPHYDTAGAAKMLVDQELTAGAIASPLCAEIYGLEILKEHIEDDPSNRTRFLMLARQAQKAEGDKCSLVFSTPHQAGKLFGVLQAFADANINLTRIASMPHRTDPGNYNFFLDFEGSDQDPRIQKVIDHVGQHAQSLNFLGCYPKGI